MTNKEEIVMQRKSFTISRNPFRWSKKSKTKLIRSGEQAEEVCGNEISNATQKKDEATVKVANNSSSVKRSSSFVFVRRCLTRFIEQVSPSLNKVCLLFIFIIKILGTIRETRMERENALK